MASRSASTLMPLQQCKRSVTRQGTNSRLPKLSRWSCANERLAYRNLPIMASAILAWTPISNADLYALADCSEHAGLLLAARLLCCVRNVLDYCNQI